MTKSKLMLAASVAALAIAATAPAFADAPEPFNAAERRAALTTHPVQPSTQQTATAPLPTSNAYVNPSKK